MEVLWIDSDNIIQERIIKALERQDWTVIRTDAKTCEAKKQELYLEVKNKIREMSCFFCFSIDFYPEVARACEELGVKYAAWMYDLSSTSRFSQYAFAATTYLFVPDYSLYKKLIQQRYASVYYFPWGTEIHENVQEHIHDVSFVGSLYKEERTKFAVAMECADDYVKGYLTALIKMQEEVNGEFFLEDLLDKRSIEVLQELYPIEDEYKSCISPAWYYANSVFAKVITGELREKSLEQIAGEYEVTRYIKDENADMQEMCRGGVENDAQLAQVYGKSCINLNITFRNMESGIPVQALEIMGSGGFLMTNYQADFDNFFVPGEDYVFYSNAEELKALVKYYLENEEERCKIARQGYEKVKKYHTFDCRMESLLRIMFTKEEMQLLHGIKALEELRRGYLEGNYVSFNDLKIVEENERMLIKAEEYFNIVENERGIIFLLKKLLMEYIDVLMARRDIASWEQMILWYNRIGKVLAVSFWEMFIWRTMLLIYTDEMKLYRKNGTPISVLQFQNMKEVSEVYFKTLFLLRRIEYGIEPMDEIIEYIKERGLSDIFIRHIVERAQIDNKELVIKAIEGIWSDDRSR